MFAMNEAKEIENECERLLKLEVSLKEVKIILNRCIEDFYLGNEYQAAEYLRDYLETLESNN